MTGAAEARQLPLRAVARARGATLADAVHLALADPHAHGCVVCGGAVRRAPGGVACQECGSELAWGTTEEALAA